MDKKRITAFALSLLMMALSSVSAFAASASGGTIDGTGRILAIDYTSESGNGISRRENEEGLDCVVGHYGLASGEGLTYNGIDFGENSVNAVEIRFSYWNNPSGMPSAIEIRENSAGGKILGVLPTSELVANQYNTYTVLLNESLTGVHNICFVSYNEGAFAWFQFTQDLRTGLAASAVSTGNLWETGEVSLSIYRYADVPDEQSIQVFFAFYDLEGRLLDLAPAERICASDIAYGAMTLKGTYDLDKISLKGNMKAFVWSSLEELETLTEAIPIVIPAK